MKKKYGPLPLWAWGAVGIVAIYLYYRHSTSSSTAAANAATSDPIDPVTGVPYSQEQAAYLNDAASALTPGSGGSSGSVDTTGGGTSPDLATELADITGLITSLQDAGLVNQNQGGAAPPPAGNSDGTTPPDNASSPAVAPSAHTRMSTGHLITPKAIQAPRGTPPAKHGYTVVGTGHGNHQYVPNSLVTVPGGHLYGAVSHSRPVVAAGQVARGLGNGLWEIVPARRTPPPPPPPRRPPPRPRGRHTGGVF